MSLHVGDRLLIDGQGAAVVLDKTGERKTVAGAGRPLRLRAGANAVEVGWGSTRTEPVRISVSVTKHYP